MATRVRRKRGKTGRRVKTTTGKGERGGRPASRNLTVTRGIEKEKVRTGKVTRGQAGQQKKKQTGRRTYSSLIMQK